ncbi:MAG: BREX-3 system P-loop-containing protein BrxF [Firmicutes bacterium]|nr:BREX-3 system P-loop-containing protein BrxF [Bacillota bacterium]
MTFADLLTQRISQAAELYYRLILVVAPAGKGKTRLLKEVHKHTGAPLLNLNLELSRRMLDLTERRRVLQLPRLLSEIVDMSPSDVVLLDNTEILFDVMLKQDPLRLLQGISRNRIIVASWNGTIDNGYLTYAAPEHHEYRRYAVHDFLVVNLDSVPGR